MSRERPHPSYERENGARARARESRHDEERARADMRSLIFMNVFIDRLLAAGKGREEEE